MPDDSEEIARLLEKLEALSKRQDEYRKEISNLRNEVYYLREKRQKPLTEEIKTAETISPISTNIEAKPEEVTSASPEVVRPIRYPSSLKTSPAIPKPPKTRSDLEKFVGENLINKVGIAITVIGVAIGAKYSIDNDLINPLTRIILGYLFGVGLLGVGIKLKNKYENYSAVLVSGAMAIMYFITYSAYALYDLVPQLPAFILMAVFTAFTVVAAIKYNSQVIAHIGLVGAYAVPFLLSEGSGKVFILFTYIAIINIGILAIAFKKYWKELYYTSFGLTWLIFFAWFATSYSAPIHFALAFIFLSIFFGIFYSTFLAYKLVRKEKFVSSDIFLLILNSLLYYGIGYGILIDHAQGNQLLGVFTLCNAIIHFIVSVIIYRQKLADKNLHYLVSGLVLIFITLAVPVQLEGNWVTLLWAGEAALLFWIGRTKSVPFYERLSYPLMLFAFFSLIQDWGTTYHPYSLHESEYRIAPLLNINFLSSVLFVAAFSFINIINRSNKYAVPSSGGRLIATIRSFAIPAILVVTVYYTFRLEIANYWNQLYMNSAVIIKSKTQEFRDQHWNYDLLSFKAIWLINYSLLFVSILTFANLKRIKEKQLGLISLGLIMFTVLVFLTQGLFVLSELRESYLEQPTLSYYNRGLANLSIRYISFGFVALAVYAFYSSVRQSFNQKNFKATFDFLLHTSILWIASSEFIHWTDVLDSSQSYKLGLSILWGLYSLMLISVGIWKKKKHLRVAAIGLFAVTLIKLFVYDISHLNTISKTIMFVSLGVLLLIISFLYNKYKHFMSDEITSN